MSPTDENSLDVNSLDVNIDSNILNKAGFTQSGSARFNVTVQDYADQLFEKCVHYGDVDKGKDLPREVTHDHVRSAAYTIARSYGRPQTPKWAIYTQIGEYVFTAIGGAGAGRLDEPLGIAAFVGGAGLAVLLFVLRATHARTE